MEKLKCILLIDDDDADIFFHKEIIEEMNITDSIISVYDGEEALAFLADDNNILPELIFLDINMPKMNGWEFLSEFRKLNPEKRAKTIIVILSTYINPVDINLAQDSDTISDFETKPLTKEAIENILEKYF